LANYDRLDLSLLTDEQRALGNVDGLENGYLNHWLWNEETQDYDVTDTPFALTVSWADPDDLSCSYKGDAEIVERIAMLRNWCGLSDLTAQEYIANQEYYDLQLIEWEQQADAEAVTEMHSAYDFYADELRNAIWRTKAQTGVIAWEGNLKEAEQSILLNGDVLYDADWFYEKSEEMRAYF
ncbi:MAG: hypothetical protein IKI45_11005, partial [Oscillospiraceae bacterium]|nr:hypothetical protein [Oscillospiraceae bacterium]